MDLLLLDSDNGKQCIKLDGYNFYMVNAMLWFKPPELNLQVCTSVLIVSVEIHQ